MTEIEDTAELLFFDTFSHEFDTDNLDLVQFPKPVYITQVRIIPLGARVQADFPGGVRLGATNPSKFGIEFFVNDLGMPGASTFENLGQLEYNQNDCIHLECSQEKIPTDGLVLRGWYSTITLAVYGILTNSMTEPIASPPPPPCETTGPEEICNVSGGAVNVTNEDAAMLKEEWKEPLPGEVPHVHPHKVSASVDYERSEDLDYGGGLTRETHYHHSGDERERRMRKSSRSSERSVSSRNRTHSESNERDYMRSRADRDRGEKNSRDWSRSPTTDYSTRRVSRRKRSERSRSDAEEPHKWPRTPPVSIDSPTRPRSPDTMDYATTDAVEESFYKIKLKSRVYRRSSESLSNLARDDGDGDDDGTPGTPGGEQFEPILSDDEIIGDDDDDSLAATAEQVAADEFEAELVAAAISAEPAIVAYNAYKMPLNKYVCDSHVQYSKELENLRTIFKKFELLQTKYGGNLATFKAVTTGVDDREHFVFYSEQLINQLIYLAQQYKRRQFVLQEFFKSGENGSSQYLEQAFCILQIALDFEAACLQAQPAFKIRHIKVGVRLAELLGASAEFFVYLLSTQQFDPFEALFSLYQQQYMALSIKLMLLKAIYALLDTKVAVQHFVKGGKLNGYQMLLETLQQSYLTRTKYALQAIVKKLNLNETLACIREQCSQLFVLSCSADSVALSYQLCEQAIEQLLDAFAVNVLSYEQPRRFLPVSKKFEIVVDTQAQRSFANSLQSYFAQQSLAESLLLLLCNAVDLPQTLLLCCLDMLQALLQSHVGIDYLVDDCFETTQMLVATLLGIEDIATETSSPDEIEQEVDEAQDMPSKEPKSATQENQTTASSIDNLEDTDTIAKQHEDAAKIETPNAIVVNDESKSKSSCSTEAKSHSSPSLARPILYRLQKLGIELAYKIQTRYHLDVIVFTATSNEYDSIKLATHLHALYSQTCNSAGREYTIAFIGLNNNFQVFMDLIKKEQRLQAQRHISSPGTKYKSPVLSYAVDMVDCCVRYADNLDYLIEHGANILELAKNHDTFEPSVSAVLQEMFVYLKPLETINLTAYDDITPLVEVLTRSLEYITTFPGDLIMGLRILRHLAVGSATQKVAAQSADNEELKHRFVSLQFYAADGVQMLIQIIERLCSYFEQPGLHAPALITIQGVHCCQILLPALQVLREMLSFAIQCRDVSFKDLTAIDHLMNAYCLLYYFPAASPAAKEVALAKKEIVQTLLAYTQPNELDEESLHKSLWTLMIREILKNINGPSTMIPGLQVLAELLPLPLPIQLPSAANLEEDQTQRLITERKLWSAHLHPQSAQIAKLIETIAPSSFPQLSDLMARVCLQLADLAPNMTLLISKTLTDLLYTEWMSNISAPTQHLSRLLQFVARLTAHASLKSSALSILSGRLWDLFQAILTASDPTDIAFKCQVSIHRILESFLDSEISLISTQSTVTPELNLASALPPKELIPRIVDAILTNLLSVDVTHEVSALGVRNLVILTEHDITFYHLALLLKQRNADVQLWLQKIIDLNELTSYNSNIESLVLLLRSLTQIEESAQPEANIPTRTLKLNATDLANIIGFKKDVQPHILQRIHAILKKQKESSNDALLGDVEKLTSSLETIDSTGFAMETDEENVGTTNEPILPQTEGIVTQYAARPIFTVSLSSNVDDEQFCADYWLATLRIDKLSSDELDKEYERISCDLTELSNICLLPSDSNLTTDCKRVLHLSASPQSNRERTPTAPCFRTRRVEVEPSTGRPEKKIYITPVRGRGFSRPPPSRGDLFRSRPPNTSRPPSLHVDDFLALETCGAQPTGPTGYNKIPPLMRGSRVGRNRGSRISSAAAYRKTKILRTSSPSTWNDGSYRTATSEPHFGGVGSDMHYSSAPHFGGGRPRGRGGRGRSSYIR